VTGASGSFESWRSANTRLASEAPTHSSSASRNIAFSASCPPLAPNRAAMSAADATASFGANGVAGMPFARYHALIPAA